MFLLILESIGTSELILIGIIALIFLGPRKLPQIAKTIGKTMAEFRSTTNEFKSTWQREVDFEDEAHALRTGDLRDEVPAAIPRIDSVEENTHTMAAPEIRGVQTDLFTDLPVEPEATADPVEEGLTTEESAPDTLSDKRNWL